MVFRLFQQTPQVCFIKVCRHISQLVRNIQGLCILHWNFHCIIGERIFQIRAFYWRIIFIPKFQLVGRQNGCCGKFPFFWNHRCCIADSIHNGFRSCHFHFVRCHLDIFCIDDTSAGTGDFSNVALNRILLRDHFIKSYIDGFRRNGFHRKLCAIFAGNADVQRFHT